MKKWPVPSQLSVSLGEWPSRHGMRSCVRVSQIVLFIGRPYVNVESIKFYVNVVAKDEDSHKTPINDAQVASDVAVCTMRRTIRQKYYFHSAR